MRRLLSVGPVQMLGICGLLSSGLVFAGGLLDSSGLIGIGAGIVMGFANLYAILYNRLRRYGK